MRQETRNHATRAPTNNIGGPEDEHLRGVLARSPRGRTASPSTETHANASAALCACDSSVFTPPEAQESRGNSPPHAPFSTRRGKMEAVPTELTRSFLSYRMLKEVLETSNIKEEEEVRAGRQRLACLQAMTLTKHLLLCRPSW